MKSHFIALALPFLFITYSSPSTANPFSSCPTIGYLFHDTANVSFVDIDRQTSNAGAISNKFDALGFNATDNYIYGVMGENIVRINNGFVAETIGIEDLPQHDYSAGDIHNNQLYLYAKSQGLWRVDLSTQIATQLLLAQHAIYNLSDLAVHPEGVVYALDDSKNIHRFDLSQSLENNHIAITAATGLKGLRTFSGQFFDSNGMLYIIDAQTGESFIFDDLTPFDNEESFHYEVLQTLPNVENTVDIARCSEAVLAVNGYDFGDAPNSYGTSLSVNGARHEVSTHLYLGAKPDQDLLAQFYPFFDNNGSDDDDQGITFTTPSLHQGANTFITAQVGGFATGYLSAWIDWDNNGNFDINENVIQDVALTGGAHTLAINVPSDAAITNQTWARFRLNDAPNILVQGAGGRGEVEDYPLTITSYDTQESYFWYPSQGTYATLAFEDRWPNQDDYDFNDIVIQYRVGHIQETVTGKLSRLNIDIKLQAYGAGYNNGFAIKLDGISASSIDANSSYVIINNEYKSSVLEEPDSPDDEAVLIFTDAIKEYFSSECENGFLRVYADCDLDKEVTVQASMAIKFTTPVDYPEHLHPYLNPFIFAAPNDGHGFPSPPSRSLEIHLKDFSPTTKANTSLFKSGNDQSENASVSCGVENNCNSYRNNSGIPFAILIPSQWDNPIEGKSILAAYPKIEDYINSNGTTDKTWFIRPEASKVYSLPEE
ncbi:LruC domain-containing protein [Photobacterium lucens]|uniref:LruC domain-containing protein n=1 Tax=Photobacterium lucens TaxID=2562949 RepID=UPI001369699D|nr:LruC domain-containing protein [Photobacterium lucens]MBP2698559.1 LruC domain-containing protein [Vibrio parahaemolyticus]MZG57944.1 LruC domain-containing protein [Photobacterium lucens]MZG79164.1 LruC domain-containing protein [Photobacterium lucens]